MNIKKIILFLKNIKKIQFNLKHEEIVVFDGYSESHLKYILEEYNYFIFEDRLEKINTIYISPLILYNFLKYLFLISKKYSLKVIYSIAVIKSIKPKILITSIDNSINFFLISKVLKNSIFCLAIQNNWRGSHADQESYLIKKNLNYPKNYKDLFYLPNYVCFGRVVSDSYVRQKFKIINAYHYGSIQIANFFQFIKKNNISLKKNLYDVCFISEPGLDKNFKNFDQTIIKLLKFSIKACIQNNLKLIFASKYLENTDNSKSEINFYKNNLNKEEFEYLTLNMNIKKNNNSSYMVLSQSTLGIGIQSSLLYNKMSCREKILACNFINEKLFDFPIKGICSMKNPTFEEFTSRVKMILSLKADEYFKKIKNDPQYFINFDSKEKIINKTKELIRNNLN